MIIMPLIISSFFFFSVHIWISPGMSIRLSLSIHVATILLKSPGLLKLTEILLLSHIRVIMLSVFSSHWSPLVHHWTWICLGYLSWNIPACLLLIKLGFFMVIIVHLIPCSESVLYLVQVVILATLISVCIIVRYLPWRSDLTYVVLLGIWLWERNFTSWWKITAQIIVSWLLLSRSSREIQTPSTWILIHVSALILKGFKIIWH